MPLAGDGRWDTTPRRLLILSIGILLFGLLGSWSGAARRSGSSPSIEVIRQQPSGMSSAPESAPQAAPLSQRSEWDLIFADEFDGRGLDTQRWHTCFWWASSTCSIESNNEEQVYTRDNVLVEDGLLRLRAERRSATAWNGKTYRYTSGMVMTGGRMGEKPPSFTFTYGYAEARMRIPRGRGFWSAFWLLPANYESRPEIDITEIIGLDTTVHNMNYHYLNPNGSRGDRGSTWIGPDFSGDWHTFGVDWRPDAIVWYVDGVERWRYTDRATISSEPSYPVLNLAVGGVWPGPPNASTPFPSTLDVDYVRIWKHVGGGASRPPVPDLRGDSTEAATAAALNCQNRPPVEIDVRRISGGRLQIDANTTTNDAVSSNALEAVTIVGTDNAVVEVVDSATGLSGPTRVPLAPGTEHVQVRVQRESRAEYMVNLTFTDRCGDWPAFVGEGS